MSDRPRPPRVTQAVLRAGYRAVARRLYGGRKGRSRIGRLAAGEALQAAATIQHMAAETAARVTGDELLKVWNNVGDDRVRATHSAAGGQRRVLDQPFNVGGEALQHPRDPNGSAGETANCRCFETYERA